MFQTIRRQFLAGSPGTATRPATRSPAWTRSTSDWTTGCPRPATSGCTPRPDRVAPEPSQDSYSHFAGRAVPEGLLVGVTARTGAPASGVEVCPLLAGGNGGGGLLGAGRGCPGTGIAGHSGGDGRRGPRLERSPAHSSGWGSPAAGRPLAKRLRPAAWLHRKRTEGPRALAAVLGAGRMLVIVLAQAA
jgi:hypothetical protein